MRGNLRSRSAVQTSRLQVLTNLLAAQAVRFQVLARVPFDFGYSVPLDVNVIP